MKQWTKIVKANENEAKKHLRNLIYQVLNGGILQYCFNGYADDLLEYIKSHNIIQELEELGCPEQGIELMQHTINKLNEEQPQSTCQYCSGTGEVETTDVDGEGDQIRETCYECDGDGYEVVNKWTDTDEQHWMSEFDNWFNYDTFDIDSLDDWTEQSHTHSVILDMMKNKGE